MGIIMNISGLQKLTLLDYPNHIACTVFTNGCNFRCPFCHNASLVVNPVNDSFISETELFSFLKKRKGILEGVCITGGEPTLQRDLISFIDKIKELGYLVKLDTNGFQPEVLQELIQSKKIDYVAMDIKNSKEKYSKTIGLDTLLLHPIEKSVELLLTNKIPYEFRTTIVKEYHTLDDFTSIGQWLKGATRYYLQEFKDSGELIKKGLHALNKDEMLQIKEILTDFIPNTYLRGMD